MPVVVSCFTMEIDGGRPMHAVVRPLCVRRIDGVNGHALLFLIRWLAAEVPCPPVSVRQSHVHSGLRSSLMGSVGC